MVEALSDEAGGLFVEFSDDLELVEDQDLADRFMVCCQVTLLQTCKQCLKMFGINWTPFKIQLLENCKMILDLPIHEDKHQVEDSREKEKALVGTISKYFPPHSKITLSNITYMSGLWCYTVEAMLVIYCDVRPRWRAATLGGTAARAGGE